MSHFSHFFFVCLFFFLVIPHGKSSILGERSAGIINQTCKTCAEESESNNYYFCLTSLQAIPISHSTNLQGLGLVAMELALQNATTTASSIEKLLNSTAFDPFALACIEDCLELYSGTVMTLVDAMGAFLSGDYISAKMWLSAVMEAVTMCEEGFAEQAGEFSPLTKENYDLFHLCNIGLCIIYLLTQDVPS